MGREPVAYIPLASKETCTTIISFPGNRHLGSHGFGHLYYLKTELGGFYQYFESLFNLPQYCWDIQLWDHGGLCNCLTANASIQYYHWVRTD